ncbi:MAG TPA: response regulator [Ktedonobacteraceae bacterium]|nr:response regulator [Ktedonobacteraceae bacterium]
MEEKSEKHAADYTILVVDDSEDMRVLLYELLHEEEYTVLLAESGQEALDKATLHHPHLILMDMSLPGMSGWEAVKRLRQLDEFRTTPIIAVTAHTAKGDAERSLAAGCTSHVDKPFDILALLEQIEGLLMSSSIS